MALLLPPRSRRYLSVASWPSPPSPSRLRKAAAAQRLRRSRSEPLTRLNTIAAAASEGTNEQPTRGHKSLGELELGITWCGAGGAGQGERRGEARRRDRLRKPIVRTHTYTRTRTHAHVFQAAVDTVIAQVPRHRGPPWSNAAEPKAQPLGFATAKASSFQD